MTANLLVRADLHPALMYLFLDAASEIHGRQTLLADAGRFPNPSRQEFPLSDEAERFYKSGKPFLQRYLPFWVANLADRMLVFLIPLIAVLLPTIRFLPDLIAYKPRARIAALYAKLRALEREIASTRDVARIPEYVERLDAIEAEVTNAKLSGWYAQDVYALRAAIDLVRERLGAPGREGDPGLSQLNRGLEPPRPFCRIASASLTRSLWLSGICPPGVIWSTTFGSICARLPDASSLRNAELLRQLAELALAEDLRQRARVDRHVLPGADPRLRLLAVARLLHLAEHAGEPAVLLQHLQHDLQQRVLRLRARARGCCRRPSCRPSFDPAVRPEVPWCTSNATMVGGRSLLRARLSYAAVR